MKHLARHFDKICELAIFLTVLLGIAVGFSGCVSVKLGGNDGHKQSEVSYVPPNKPFESITLENADKAWQNKKTGGTLSYRSQCQGNADPSLESLRDSTLLGLDSAEVINDQKISFNGREAVKTQVKGKLDGVSVLVRLLIFKKNFCRYTITMVGIENHSQDDFQIYEHFIEKFEAP